VLIPQVAVYLSLKDLFNLRCCSRTAQRFVEAALEKRQELHLSGNNTSNIDVGFRVLARCCRRLEVLHLACCRWLTDELLLPLLANNKKRLWAVNLNECVNITAFAITAEVNSNYFSINIKLYLLLYESTQTTNY